MRNVTEQSMIYFCLLAFLGKLEIGLTYATSFYSEHICTRCYYLYSLTLFGVSWYLLVCKLGQTNFKKSVEKYYGSASFFTKLLNNTF